MDFLTIASLKSLGSFVSLSDVLTTWYTMESNVGSRLLTRKVALDKVRIS